MKVYFEEIPVSTNKRFELIDITDKVEEAVRNSNIRNGICLVFAPHATAAIVANEHERGLMEDILTKIQEIVQPERNWKHNLIDDNAHAHLGGALIGADRVFPVKDGELVRGTWQNIFLVEMDGPRSRRHVIVEVLGE
ncbi:MAG: secondary thiamine-phosphate synthase enzyme YjbQ [Sulfolobaceae archaeon]|nr:secondary thiamine-phosphate synthase enzyme YjbQ [Sulfolobaceae archaeon]